MLSHAFEHGVLVISLDVDPGITGRAPLLQGVEGLVRAYGSAPVVMVLGPHAVGDPAVSVVLRTVRLCGDKGTRVCVVAPNATTRHMLQAGAESRGMRVPLQPRAELAVSAVRGASAVPGRWAVHPPDSAARGAAGRPEAGGRRPPPTTR